MDKLSTDCEDLSRSFLIHFEKGISGRGMEFCIFLLAGLKCKSRKRRKKKKRKVVFQAGDRKASPT